MVNLKRFSVCSIGFILLGLLFLGINWMLEGLFEPMVLLGIILLVVGAVLSFIAIARKEEGKLKLISLLSFFIVLLFISWFEPFQVVRVMTWLKNID